MTSKPLDKADKTSPTLEYAQQLQNIAAHEGFEWKDIQDLLAKVREEIDELEEALGDSDQAHIQEELGDLLFVLVNFARMSGFSAEEALQDANAKFIQRFEGMQQDVERTGRSLKEMSLGEMVAVWNAQKKKFNPGSTIAAPVISENTP